MKKIFFFCVIGVWGVGCVPKNLEKYRQNSNSLSSSSGKKSSFEREDALDTTSTASHPGLAPSGAKKNLPKTSKTQQASIYAIDDQTFRFSLPEKDVWNTALNVLMRNYNLTIVDKDSGVITTEWDSFYLEDKVYRNRISLRIQRASMTNVDVMVHNNVEKLQDGAALGGVWLPSEDKAQEIKRVIQNMAILLNEPPPQFLKTMTAESEELKQKNY